MKFIKKSIKFFYQNTIEEFNYIKLLNYFNNFKNKNIFLTYDNKAQTDGLGAQILRIYSIYCLSKTIGVPYLYSPILDICWPPKIDKFKIKEYNSFFNVFKEVNIESEYKIFNLFNPSSKDIIKISQENKLSLIKINLPYRLIERRINDNYNHLKKIKLFTPPPQEDGSLRIAIHRRAGDDIVNDSSRFLPDYYYLDLILMIKKVLEHNKKKYIIDFFSDDWGDGRFLNKVNSIGGVFIESNATEIELLTKMATADILVMSRSTFSYFPALFNKGIVVYYPWVHPPLRNWIIASDIKRIEKELFKKLIINYDNH